MKKIKISFIGAGNIIEQHLRVFKSFNNVELTGIHSRTKAKAKKLALKYGIKHILQHIKHEIFYPHFKEHYYSKKKYY